MQSDKKEHWPLPHIIQKYLNVKVKTIKFLEENREVHLNDFEIGKDPFKIGHKSTNHKEKKLINWTSLKLRISIWQRKPLRQWKGMLRPREDICNTNTQQKTRIHNI